MFIVHTNRHRKYSLKVKMRDPLAVQCGRCGGVSSETEYCNGYITSRTQWSLQGFYVRLTSKSKLGSTILLLILLLRCLYKLKDFEFTPITYWMSSVAVHSFNNSKNFFFLIFVGHKSFLWGHWYPCFGLLVTSALGFNARVDSSLVWFLTYSKKFLLTDWCYIIDTFVHKKDFFKSMWSITVWVIANKICSGSFE